MGLSLLTDTVNLRDRKHFQERVSKYKANTRQRVSASSVPVNWGGRFFLAALPPCQHLRAFVHFSLILPPARPSACVPREPAARLAAVLKSNLPPLPALSPCCGIVLTAADRFDLPEERAIVSSLVKAGYAVVAPASKDRVSG